MTQKGSVMSLRGVLQWRDDEAIPLRFSEQTLMVEIEIEMLILKEN